ncbi:uncharacterized protein Z518_07165 [Rhinocladiella mackenziei CBS 650.93]|uniref:Rhinocladiella mackenziei CBS 650.93 unplaced genomic scaffold supercont1.5, whole genome shotgun sequence n=1 Tax=Rhinocladiella mackenziei CBS 650.93 TaxID=1442369 RepID=A0A0D2FNI4_9EURO|nr:uncharacterized protein Z518_07165 [Rhinocladiella mackenziei CBS 650.93]KIX03612.1 hypothetical protein Z518_07165 [Rhinocladiella mackenziei CBS 650.93]
MLETETKGSPPPSGFHLENTANEKPDDQTPTLNAELQREIEAFENRTLDFRTFMAIIALAFTYEAHLLCFVLPAALLLTINRDIGPSDQINWVATSWTLSGAVAQTIAGSCSDIFGRRNFTIAGNLFGVVGCIIASQATSVNTIIIGMSLMGFGTAPQLLSLACATEIVPKRNRGETLAFLNLASLPGSAFGSVIAYALAEHLNWRWAFYLGIIANGLALVLVIIFYWPPGFIGLHPEGKTRMQQFKELDFVGLLLFGGGLTSFLLGVSFGGNPYDWISVTVFILFPIWEIYSPDTITKLCPPYLFKNVRGFTLPLIVIFVTGMLLISLQVLWPQQVQLLFTTDPESVGWYSLAYNATGVLGALISGPLFARIKFTRVQFVAYTALQAVFIAAMASVTQHTAAKAIVFVAIAAFGVGASQIVGILFVQFGAKDKQIGVATGLTGTFRATGGSIAIAIYTSIINQQSSNNLVPSVSEATVKAGLPPTSVPSLLQALQAMLSGTGAAPPSVPGLTPAVVVAAEDAVKTVYSNAYQLVYLVSITFGGEWLRSRTKEKEKKRS